MPDDNDELCLVTHQSMAHTSEFTRARESGCALFSCLATVLLASRLCAFLSCRSLCALLSGPYFALSQVMRRICLFIFATAIAFSAACSDKKSAVDTYASDQVWS